ncbi:MAG: peptidoglycan editing factor PgeF [Firmicutes bacterium]|nr:peptidoglycan editing factor PgeF [Bacillota bacterium]
MGFIGDRIRDLPTDVLTYRGIDGVGFFELDAALSAPNLVCAFSTRVGGVSQGPFASLNLGMHVGDDSQTVLINRQRLSHALGISLDEWVTAEQVHGGAVAVVTDSHRGRGAFSKELAVPGVDGLVTNTPGTWLVCFYADCVPMVFWDIAKGVVGIAHAGWRGALTNIGGAVVRAMQERFGSPVGEIRALIGPAIGPCCYEVGEDVGEKFRSLFGNDVLTQRGGRMHLHLPKANYQYLLDGGLLARNIYISRLCTACNRDMFYSYRRDKGPTGRMAAVVGLRE